MRNLNKKTVVLAVGGLLLVALTASFADDLIPQDSPVEATTAPLLTAKLGRLALNAALPSRTWRGFSPRHPCPSLALAIRTVA